MDLLLPFPNQSVFQIIQKRSGVFLGLDLWKAMTDTGKAGASQCRHDRGSGNGGVCLCERERKRESSAHHSRAVGKAGAGELGGQERADVSLGFSLDFHQLLWASRLRTQTPSSPT